MMVFFSPWRMLGFACFLAFGGSVFLYGSIQDPHQDHPLWIGVVFGVCLELLALWIAITAVRYIVAGICAIMRGPK
jgi:hypothetical protein